MAAMRASYLPRLLAVRPWVRFGTGVGSTSSSPCSGPISACTISRRSPALDDHIAHFRRDDGIKHQRPHAGFIIDIIDLLANCACAGLGFDKRQGVRGCRDRELRQHRVPQHFGGDRRTIRNIKTLLSTRGSLPENGVPAVITANIMSRRRFAGKGRGKNCDGGAVNRLAAAREESAL